MNRWMIPVSVAAGAVALSSILATTASAQTDDHASGTHQTKPTIVLVSGAFEDSSSWSGEISRLERRSYPVIAPAVP
jgi:pimeloyl-ACP methyl ester carboxylesterase